MENNKVKAKAMLGSVYGKVAELSPSEYIQNVKYQFRRPGRPVTIGSGRKLSIYLPLKTLALMERIQEQWSFDSQSDLIQEAIARYAAELDGVMQEGDQDENK